MGSVALGLFQCLLNQFDFQRSARDLYRERIWKFTKAPGFRLGDVSGQGFFFNPSVLT